jgi:hypothetical protein
VIGSFVMPNRSLAQVLPAQEAMNNVAITLSQRTNTPDFWNIVRAMVLGAEKSKA